MTNKTEGLGKAVKFVGKKIDLSLERLGGGTKKVIEIRTSNPELLQAKNSYKEALEASKQARLQFKEAMDQEGALFNKYRDWKRPNSTRNQKRLDAAALKQKDAGRKSLEAFKKMKESEKVFKNTKDLVTSEALELVRNKGIKRLNRIGLVGALGAGAYPIFSSGDSSKEELKTPLYKYDPTNGWQEYNDKTGQYENQLIGFGIDRFGNTNYYNGQTWLTPNLYIQGSDGSVYDKRTGQFIGNAGDIMAMHALGYNNIFDYRAVQAGYNSPEAVRQLQTQLGVTADGKWGQLTLDAFDRATKEKWSQLYDINNLFSIYLNRV